jgi:hypothetical protein
MTEHLTRLQAAVVTYRFRRLLASREPATTIVNNTSCPHRPCAGRGRPVLARAATVLCGSATPGGTSRPTSVPPFATATTPTAAPPTPRRRLDRPRVHRLLLP